MVLAVTAAHAQTPAPPPDMDAVFKANKIFDQARQAQDAGDLDNAFDLYNQAIAADPALPGAYSNRGNIYMARKNYDAALADYNKAIAINPKISHFFIARGGLYLTQRQYDLAIADLTQAIGLGGGSEMPHAYELRGLCRFAKKDYAAAIADYDQAIALDVSGLGLDRYYADRGRAKAEGKDYAGAIADFDEAIKPRSPGHSISERGAARPISTELKLRRRVRRFPDHALAIAPDNPGLLNARCWYRALANREIDGAIADCNTALVKAPSNSYIADSLGFAWFRKGDFDKAIASTNLALTARPDFPPTLYVSAAFAEKPQGRQRWR